MKSFGFLPSQQISQIHNSARQSHRLHRVPPPQQRQSKQQRSNTAATIPAANPASALFMSTKSKVSCPGRERWPRMYPDATSLSSAATITTQRNQIPVDNVKARSVLVIFIFLWYCRSNEIGKVTENCLVCILFPDSSKFQRMFYDVLAIAIGWRIVHILYSHQSNAPTKLVHIHTYLGTSEIPTKSKISLGTSWKRKSAPYFLFVHWMLFALLYHTG